jgi:hypothetical protein
LLLPVGSPFPEGTSSSLNSDYHKR